MDKNRSTEIRNRKSSKIFPKKFSLKRKTNSYSKKLLNIDNDLIGKFLDQFNNTNNKNNHGKIIPRTKFLFGGEFKLSRLTNILSKSSSNHLIELQKERKLPKNKIFKKVRSSLS